MLVWPGPQQVCLACLPARVLACVAPSPLSCAPQPSPPLTPAGRLLHYFAPEEPQSPSSPSAGGGDANWCGWHFDNGGWLGLGAGRTASLELGLLRRPHQ